MNKDTIPDIPAEVICGAANNQLATDKDGDRLRERGVLYAPDYLVNAGGLISVAREPLGLGEGDARAKLQEIPETLRRVLQAAQQQGICPGKAADRMAEETFGAAA